MVLYSGKLTERNSACESNIHEGMTRGEIWKLPRELRAPRMITARNRAAARAA
jgi:hypothetical protein